MNGIRRSGWWAVRWIKGRIEAPTSSSTSSGIHFWSWLIRQVSCYTLLCGFWLPWPPSCCVNHWTPFVSEQGVERKERNKTTSIFGVSWFGKWAVTHSSTDFDFHDQRLAVLITEHPLWVNRGWGGRKEAERHPFSIAIDSASELLHITIWGSS